MPSPESFARARAYLYQELMAGAREEMEHTDKPIIAVRIALDHILEDVRYYQKLRAAGLMEKSVRKGGMPEGTVTQRKDGPYKKEGGEWNKLESGQGSAKGPEPAQEKTEYDASPETVKMLSNTVLSHQTTKENASKIQDEGFTVSHNGLLGLGAYFHVGPGPELKGERAEVKVKVSPKKVLEMDDVTDFPNIYRDLTGRHYSGGNGDEERHLRELGFDSVYVKNDNWFVAFDKGIIKIEKKP